MVSVRAMECLVAIVEQGSLTKAAAALHMSQPAYANFFPPANSSPLNRRQGEGK